MTTTNLLQNIRTFNNTSEKFIEILKNFKSKINYLNYKLSYDEAESDLILYLYELIRSIDCIKFKCDDDIASYINKCLQNKAIALHNKIAKDKEKVILICESEEFDLTDISDFQDEYSDIIFNDLISSLNPNQRKIIFYRFYLQLSSIEIAKKLNISRQAVNRTQRTALKNLRQKLLN